MYVLHINTCIYISMCAYVEPNSEMFTHKKKPDSYLFKSLELLSELLSSVWRLKHWPVLASDRGNCPLVICSDDR